MADLLDMDPLNPWLEFLLNPRGPVDRGFERRPESLGDPQERIAEIIQAQASAGNENPLLNKPRGRDLPPDYQIETRPYRGPSEQETEQMLLKQMQVPRASPEAALEKLRRYEESVAEVEKTDPVAAYKLRMFGTKGPKGDADWEYIFGDRATSRLMRGGGDQAGGLGMDLEQVGRQPNMPPSRRFGDVQKRGTLRQAELDALEQDLENATDPGTEDAIQRRIDEIMREREAQ